MAAEVGEERLPKGNLEGWLTRSYRVFELAPRLVGLRSTVQRHVAQRSSSIRTQQIANLRDRDPTTGFDDKSQTLKPTHHTK